MNACSIGDLAGLFTAFDFDERVLDLDLRPELDAIGKAMADHQDEAMQIASVGRCSTLLRWTSM
jgi:hypothetical protein